jgi:hypothetical protein
MKSKHLTRAAELRNDDIARGWAAEKKRYAVFGHLRRKRLQSENGRGDPLPHRRIAASIPVQRLPLCLTPPSSDLCGVFIERASEGTLSRLPFAPAAEIAPPHRHPPALRWQPRSTTGDRADAGAEGAETHTRLIAFFVLLVPVASTCAYSVEVLQDFRPIWIFRRERLTGPWEVLPLQVERPGLDTQPIAILEAVSLLSASQLSAYVRMKAIRLCASLVRPLSYSSRNKKWQPPR